jgi:hypothetical protein
VQPPQRCNPSGRRLLQLIAIQVSHRHGVIVTQQAPALLLLVRGFVPGFLYHISTDVTAISI